MFTAILLWVLIILAVIWTMWCNGETYEQRFELRSAIGAQVRRNETNPDWDLYDEVDSVTFGAHLWRNWIGRDPYVLYSQRVQDIHHQSIFNK